MFECYYVMCDSSTCFRYYETDALKYSEKKYEMLKSTSANSWKIKSKKPENF